MFAKMMSWQFTITLNTAPISIFPTSFMSKIPTLDWHPFSLVDLDICISMRLGLGVAAKRCQDTRGDSRQLAYHAMNDVQHLARNNEIGLKLLSNGLSSI
jgi:hypothetical protein